MALPDADTLNGMAGLITAAVTGVMTILGFIFGHKSGKAKGLKKCKENDAEKPGE